MRTYLDCYPCFVRQALEAARMAGANQRQQRAVLNRVFDVLQRADSSDVPPVIGSQVHRIVRQEVGNSDPYREVKEAGAREGLALYPWMQSLLAGAEDRLDTAVRLSIAGNIIDFGPAQQYDLTETVKRVLAQPFAIDEGSG